MPLYRIKTQEARVGQQPVIISKIVESTTRPQAAPRTRIKRVGTVPEEPRPRKRAKRRTK